MQMSFEENVLFLKKIRFIIFICIVFPFIFTTSIKTPALILTTGKVHISFLKQWLATKFYDLLNEIFVLVATSIFYFEISKSAAKETGFNYVFLRGPLSTPV
jgi:hypothetical protein